MALPVITVAQMRQWEGATWAAGIKPADVIATAGQCVARAALRLTRAGERILILAGKGHNGDDARAAASGLGERTVEIISVLDPRAAREVFLRQIQADSTAKPAPKPALLIDGIFGIGLNRPLDSEWIALFAALNESGLPILAIDVPSGVNADTGEVRGAALHAAVTLTLGAPKIGLVQARAAAFVGRLEVAANLGLLPCGLHSDLHWTQAADFAAFPPRRPVAGHKGTFGHVGILAGSLGYHGAAVLAARAASRAMPGLVTLFTAEDVFTPVAVQLQNVMVHPGRPSFAELHDYSAVMVGPGLADEKLAGDLRELIAEIWHNLDRPVIADASALDWLPAGATTTTALRVITPHPGEAARMLRVTARKFNATASRPFAVFPRVLGIATSCSRARKHWSGARMSCFLGTPPRAWPPRFFSTAPAIPNSRRAAVATCSRVISAASSRNPRCRRARPRRFATPCGSTARRPTICPRVGARGRSRN